MKNLNITQLLQGNPSVLLDLIPRDPLRLLQKQLLDTLELLLDGIPLLALLIACPAEDRAQQEGVEH